MCVVVTLIRFNWIFDGRTNALECCV